MFYFTRRLLRAVRLGLALLDLEDAESSGASLCIHNSWCSAPGSGWWIAIVRPAAWARRGARGACGACGALGKPVVGRDLCEVMRRARGIARGQS